MTKNVRELKDNITNVTYNITNIQSIITLLRIAQIDKYQFPSNNIWETSGILPKT